MSSDCTWVRAHLAELLDEELSGPDRARAREHLASCASCRAALDRLRAVDQASREAFLAAPAAAEPPRPGDGPRPALSGQGPARAEQRPDPAEELLRSLRLRFDLEAAERLRRREREQAAAAHRGSASAQSCAAASGFLSGEEVADLALEESLHRQRTRAAARAEQPAAQPAGAGGLDRGTWVRRVRDFWLNPPPRTRWLQLAGGTAAVAALAVLLLARDPDMARHAIDLGGKGQVAEEAVLQEEPEPPGWQTALHDLLEMTGGLDSQGGPSLDAQKPEELLMMTESRLADQMARSREDPVAMAAGRPRAQSPARQARPQDSESNAIGAPRPGSDLEDPFDERVRAWVATMPLPVDDRETAAYLAVANGWFELWRSQPDQLRKARHAARYYGALHLAAASRDLALSAEDQALIRERLLTLDPLLQEPYNE